MNARNPKDKRQGPSAAVQIMAAVAAAIAGFAAVYVTLWPTGNQGALPFPGVVTRGPAPTTPPAAQGSGPLAGLNTGKMAAFVIKAGSPEVADAPFNGPDGASTTLKAWRGKVVLVNLWATWCKPCREEMPALDALKAQLGGSDFDVVAISVDLGSPDKPRAFLAEVGATHLQFYHDPSAKLGASLKAIGMPTTMLIDAQGREMGRLVGPADWASSEAKALIEAAIAAGKAS